MRACGLAEPHLKEKQMPRGKEITIDGETRSDLVFVRLSPTEKARIRALQQELNMESMSAVIRYLTNTYFEISHRKAS
jgi:hypothetical protein